MTTLFSSLPFLLAAPEGGTSSSGGSMVTTFITFGLIIVVFYFLIIRPQRKRDKDTKAMINAVKKGDKVVTIGGIRGTVMSVKDTVIVLKVDDNTKLEFNKSAVSTVLEKKGESPKVEKVAAPAKKSTKAKSAQAAKVPEAEAEAETETTEETEKEE
ncbi:MAG: preprotein translocase subunit YajC [Spirochaetes bacterium]|nr:preprotein translocase subunit YajC [Spirochaetota bacterium]